MESIRLFCLPFAGGSSYSYRLFAQHAPENIEIVPIDPPGRGKRVNETLLDNLELMAEDLFHQISDQLDQPYAIFGHSMGALAAYLLSHQILKHRCPPPLHLFLSGSGGPLVREKEKIHHLPSALFWKKIKEMEGSPEEVFKDETLMAFFEPILKADFKAVETFNYQKRKPFHIPLHIFYGDQDDISDREIKNWSLESTAPIVYQKFTGTHFFIFDHYQSILHKISQGLHHYAYRKIGVI
ncbi:MAG: alpha/beta fold hydrolase [Bacteroidota bacterium]